MTKQAENMITKGIAFGFASLLTITGWLAKTEVTSMADTLKEIRKDVSTLNTKALLQEQEVKHQFDWSHEQIALINKRISSLEAIK